MKKCPKCGSVVKDWDIVCPVCGATTVSISEPKNSIKIKGNIPGWEDYKEKGKERAAGGGEDDGYDQKLVRAAIKSDYEEGRTPKEKALEALGHVSMLEGGSAPAGEVASGGEIEEIEEIEEGELEEVDDGVEMLGREDLEASEGAEQLGFHDVMEIDTEASRPGQIVVEGKKRPKKTDDEESVPASIPSFPPPRPTGGSSDGIKAAGLPKHAPPPKQVGAAQAKGEAGPPPGIAPPPRAAGQGLPAPSGEAAAPPPAEAAGPQEPSPGPSPAPKPASPDAPAPRQPVGIAPPPRQAPDIRSVGGGLPARPQKTTVPVTVPSSMMGRQNTTPPSFQVEKEPKPAEDSKRKTKTTTPPQSQQYDPESLRKIMQQAQAAAMMREVKPRDEPTHISLPLAVLLIVMGTLSIVGLAVIIFLLVKM